MTGRRVAVAGTDADPSTAPVTFGVVVTSGVAINDAPAQVRITVTNRSEDSVELHTGWPGVFGGPKSEERDPGLLLTPPGNSLGEAVRPGQQSTSVVVPGVLVGSELAAGASESITLEVSSQDPDDSPGRLPEGTFTFQANYFLSRPDGDDEERFDWEFSLDVESAT